MQQPTGHAASQSAKGARRYRISFIAHFDQIIECGNDEEARLIASRRAEAAGRYTGITGENMRCAWNTIEPLE